MTALELRQQLEDQGTKAVIPNRSNRKKKYRFDKKQYRYRHKIENAWCRLKDFRRIATRYDKLGFGILCIRASRRDHRMVGLMSLDLSRRLLATNDLHAQRFTDAR